MYGVSSRLLLLAFVVQTATPTITRRDHWPAYGQRPSVTTTADGHPDLQGIWSFATLTPLERPREFAGREYLTEADAKAFVRETIQRNDRDRRDGSAETDVGRAVNDYWFDRGTALARIGGKIRSSLIVEPPDGQVPPMTESARRATAARAADARAHPADGPENRSLQERCLTFNAGPPILPGPYNNYIQIIQTADHVVIFSEMIHEARIIPVAAAGGRPRTRLRCSGSGRAIRARIGRAARLSWTRRTSVRRRPSADRVRTFTSSSGSREPTRTRCDTSSPSTIRRHSPGHGPPSCLCSGRKIVCSNTPATRQLRARGHPSRRALAGIAALKSSAGPKTANPA